MLKRAIFYILIIVFSVQVTAQNKGPVKLKTISNNIWATGEILEYSVKYAGIKLADVKITTEAITGIKGGRAYKTKLHGYTFDHVPAVDVNATMESFVNAGKPYSHKFIRNLRLKSGNWEYQQMDFNYDSSMVFNRKWLDNTLKHDKYTRFHPDKKLVDFLALFFTGRFYARQDTTIKINTLIDNDEFMTTVNFKQKENVIVEAFDKKVKAVYAEGKANWEAGYGMRGEFRGWISDDPARIPLKGKVAFMLGNINIELVKVTRPGWKAPLVK